VVIDSPGEAQEENVAEPELAPPRPEESPEADAEETPPPPTRERRRRGSQRDEDEEAAPPPATSAAHLAFADDARRSRRARTMGFDQTPSFEDAVDALLAEEQAGDAESSSLAELLPSARIHAHPDLPEAEIRPPDFLKPLEAMKDVYLKVKGRASPKTTELLEGVALEDLVQMVRTPFEQEGLERSPEARLRGPLYRKLKDAPGPLLLGLTDPRLTELWRLFVDGWDIWLPDGREDGIELFWEGEAEEDDGAPLEILQTLSLIEGEVCLSTRLGELEDELTFDGEGFFRLKTRKARPREER
jgi:hypothetical protein